MTAKSKKVLKYVGFTFLGLFILGLILPSSPNKTKQSNPKNEVIDNSQRLIQDSISFISRINNFEKELDLFTDFKTKTVTDINKLQTDFVYLSINDLKKHKDIALKIDTLKTKLQKTMTKFYPYLRAELSSKLNDNMYKDDMTCSTYGGGNEYLTITGYIFALNKNKLEYKESPEFKKIIKEFRFQSYTLRSNKYDTGDTWSNGYNDTIILGNL